MILALIVDYVYLTLEKLEIFYALLVLLSCSFLIILILKYFRFHPKAQMNPSFFHLNINRNNWKYLTMAGQSINKIINPGSAVLYNLIKN